MTEKPKKIIGKNNNFQILRSGTLEYFTANSLPFKVSWRLTGRCPYHCSYCYEKDSPKRAYEPELEKLLLAMERLKILLSTPIINQGGILFKLFGGEPLAHKKFLPFLGALHDNFPQATISCISNGFRDIAFMEKILSIDPNFIFSFSVHFEFIKESEFIKKIQFLSENAKNPKLTFIFLPSERARVRAFADSIKKKFDNITLAIQLVRTPESNFRLHDDRYTADDKQWAKTFSSNKNRQYFIDYRDNQQKIHRKLFSFEEAFIPELSNFKGALCMLPLKHMEIFENGIVTPGFCLHTPSINIFSPDFNPEKYDLSNPAVCEYDFCTCQGMKGMPKYFDKEFAPIYMGGNPAYGESEIKIESYM